MSLLVGGIGIMNIMLVSVTERTREIGLRMAIGARGKDVLLQFLVEAVVLSLFGGLLGIGMGSALLLRRLRRSFCKWPTSIPPNAIAMAFGFAAATGVFFGFYPAGKRLGLTRSKRCGSNSMKEEQATNGLRDGNILAATRCQRAPVTHPREKCNTRVVIR